MLLLEVFLLDRVLTELCLFMNGPLDDEHTLQFLTALIFVQIYNFCDF